MKYIFLTGLVFYLAFSSVANSQPLAPSWEVSLPGKLRWMQTNDWGILIAACEDGLYGVNPQDGKRIWEQPTLMNVAEENYQSIQGTPLVLIAGKGNVANTMIINGLNGEQIFSAEEEGITAVLSTRIIPELNAVLIVYNKAGENGIALFNYLKAEKKWDTPFRNVKEAQVKVEPFIDGEGNILYCAGKSLFRLNGKNGSIIWQKETKKKLIDLFTDPDRQLVIAVSGTPSTTFYTTHGGGGANLASGTAGTIELEAFGISDGSPAWKKPIGYKKRKYSGVALGHSDFMLFHTFSVNKIDYQTGEKLWAKEKMGAGGELSAGVFDSSFGLIYATTSAGRVYLNHINSAGQAIWKRKHVINGDLLHLEQMGDYLFYISTMEANFVHMSDGVLLWENDKYLSAGEVPLALDRDKDGNFIMYIRGMLVKVMPDKKDWVRIASDFYFRNELPNGVKILPNGYLLTGNQNAMLIDPAGKIIYHQYYEAPEQSFGAKLLLGTAGTAASLGSFAYGASSMAYGLSGALENNNAHTRKAHQQMTVASFSGDLAGGLSAAVNARFGENAATNHYKLILTKSEKSIGFVKLNVLTGEEEGQIVTEDRTPDFAIDAAGDKLFLKSADNRVACYTL